MQMFADVERRGGGGGGLKKESLHRERHEVEIGCIAVTIGYIAGFTYRTTRNNRVHCGMVMGCSARWRCVYVHLCRKSLVYCSSDEHIPPRGNLMPTRRPVVN